MQTVFGPIVTADEVCVAVENTLRAWLPAMFKAMGLIGDSALELPTGYRQVPTIDALREAGLPSVGIGSPGYAREPMRDEDGNLQITWRVFVVVYVRGDDYEQTQLNTRNYAAAVATILTQQHTLLGFAVATDVISEEYEPINDGARTLGGAVIEVEVTVADARNDLAAPDGPPPDDPVAVAVVTTVDVDVEEQSS